MHYAARDVTVNRSHIPIWVKRLFIHAPGVYIYLAKSLLFHAYTAVSLEIKIIIIIILSSP
jgi:hypothetical protein